MRQVTLEAGCNDFLHSCKDTKLETSAQAYHDPVLNDREYIDYTLLQKMIYLRSWVQVT